MDQTRKQKVFLTGATGFIGSHVAELFASQEIELTCSIRTGSNASFLNTLPVKLVELDLLHREALTRCLSGMDCVIHTAGLVNDWSTFEEFHLANVAVSRSVLESCCKVGIQHVILTGTNASYGEENSTEVKDESYPDNPVYPYFMNRIFPSPLNHYRLTKHQATIEAIRIADRSGLNLTVLEPVWVYGEREFSSGFYEYMKTVKGGIPILPGSPKNKFHVIYARDLAEAYLKAFQKKLPGIHRILIGNREAPRMQEIYAHICREMGVKKPGNMPKAVAYPIGLLLEVAARLVKTRKPPVLTRSRVNMFYDTIHYNINKAENLLSFVAKTSLEEGIRNTVGWYSNNKLV